MAFSLYLQHKCRCDICTSVHKDQPISGRHSNRVLPARVDPPGETPAAQGEAPPCGSTLWNIWSYVLVHIKAQLHEAIRHMQFVVCDSCVACDAVATRAFPAQATPRVA